MIDQISASVLDPINFTILNTFKSLKRGSEIHSNLLHRARADLGLGFGSHLLFQTFRKALKRGSEILSNLLYHDRADFGLGLGCHFNSFPNVSKNFKTRFSNIFKSALS